MIWAAISSTGASEQAVYSQQVHLPLTWLLEFGQLTAAPLSKHREDSWSLLAVPLASTRHIELTTCSQYHVI